ncbi:MAG: hypothetical protein GX241_03175 [Ruminococcaceae bacterium]|nr:hypothetical protein [Oscillospiraceae bacterium]
MQKTGKGGNNDSNKCQKGASNCKTNLPKGANSSLNNYQKGASNCKTNLPKGASNDKMCL